MSRQFHRKFDCKRLNPILTWMLATTIVAITGCSTTERFGMLIITRYLNCCLALLATEALALDLDTDGDGLSDFQEQHKYLTDPHRMDSDADGVLDGDQSKSVNIEAWCICFDSFLTTYKCECVGLGGG